MTPPPALTTWTPPLDRQAMESVLDKVRRWQPFDGDALLEDIGDVLDDLMPPEDRHDELALRLRGHLMQLVHIALAAHADQSDPQADRLIQQARTVRSLELPGGIWPAVGHLRRMAWCANELLERLAAIKCLKEAAA